MKKLKFTLALLLTLAIVFAAAACTVTLEKISLKDGTLAKEVTVGETLDTSKVEIIATYSDKSTKTIKAGDKDLKIGTISTDTEGPKTLTITYMDKSIDVVITVKKPNDPNADLEIVQVNMPDFVADYNHAIAEKATAKRTEFFVRDDGYYVGDDNEFRFKPTVIIEDDGFPIDADYSLLDAEITIEIKGESGYTTVDEDEYVEVLGYGSYQFKEIAVGKTIKFTVKPFIIGYPEKANKGVSFEFTVVDGWNAYSATDFAMIEYDRMATNIEYSNLNKTLAAAWVEYKQEKGLPTDIKTNAVIMQGNISITKDDLPSIFFFNEEDLSTSDSDYDRTLGSLRDSRDIFERGILPGETFEFIGNYFTIDASKLPLVTREGEKGDKVSAVGSVVSHTTLFKLRGKNRSVEDESQRGTATFKNLYMIGNSNRSDENDGKLSGGLINHKVRDLDFTIKNSIALQWFITYFPEGTKDNASNGDGKFDTTRYLIDSCKAYDNYNSFLYVWGGGNLDEGNFFTIKDSEMIGAGGPVMICDHSNSDYSDGGYPANVKVINSKLESFVTGGEGWFQLVGATTIASQITAMDALFRANGKTFLNGDEFNFISIFKANNDSATGLINYPTIKGFLQIDDRTPLDFGQGSSVSSQTVKSYLTGLSTTGAPVFQSSVGGVATYLNGASLVKLPMPGTAVAADDDLFKGDYLNIYIGDSKQPGFMGAMFGYYEV